MVKFKEYSKRCICIISAFVCFFAAMFCPSDLFLADENTGTQIFDGNIYTGSYFISGPSSNALGVPTGEDRNLTYYSSDTSFTMSPFVPPDGLCKFRFTLYSEAISNFTSGLVSRFSVTPYIVYNGVRYDMVRYDDYWVSTFYAEASSDTNVFGVPVQFDLIFENFTSDSGTYSTSFRIDAIYLRCWQIETSEEAILDEMNSLLEDLKAELEANGDLTEEIKTLIDSILSDTDSIDNRLNDLYSLLVSYEGTYFRPILNNLKSINIVLQQIYTEEQKQTTWLEKIWNSFQEFLGLSGNNSEDYEQPPEDSEMVDLGQKEDDLLGGGTSPDDAANDLKVELDAEASAFIWDTINQFVTVNSAVFGVFISVLSLGIIALILGR